MTTALTQDIDRPVSFVEAALAASDPGRPIAIQWPVRGLTPAGLLRSLPDEDAYFWQDRGGLASAGVGRAAIVRGEGAGRFEQLIAAAARFTDRLETRVAGSSTAPRPRFFGGLSFRPDEPRDRLWSAFGDARFVLPELSCTVDRGTTWLTLCLPADRDDRAGAAATRRLRQVLARGSRAASSAGPDQDRAAVRNGAPAGEVAEPAAEEESYRALVRAALETIARGGLEKVVLARRLGVRLSTPLDLAAVARTLTCAEGTFRFALSVGDALFLGATPERLVAVSGRSVLTEAVAGTGAAGERDPALDRRRKDLWEHALVVRAIAAALGPVCSLEHDAAPATRSIGPIHHLATSFQGSLHRDTHVLELVHRLHPTPAVGGWPTEAALEWLARHETVPRGWYSGPIGWFDGSGDGEFAVALRCGVARDRRLDLFAGSGIVQGSEPDAEYEETGLKLRALPEALGLA